MKDKIYFESKKEAIAFFNKNFPVGNNDINEKRRSFVFNCNRHGHIKKSDLEKAKSCYDNLQSSHNSVVYIPELEKEIEKLKKC